MFAAHAYVTMLSPAHARLALLIECYLTLWSHDHDRDGTLYQRRTLEQAYSYRDPRQRFADQLAQARRSTAALI
jgi:predicted mannosyl-3-phosphoglycerate phosphatase (HAD superfamily)